MNSAAEEVLREATAGGGGAECTQGGEAEASDEEYVEAEGGDTNDLTRPSEWTPLDKEANKPPDNPDDAPDKPKEDSTGSCVGSPDYIDEDQLQEQENTLTEQEKEQKRLEASQYKLEGNNLYKEGKTNDAVEKYTAGLRVCPLSHSKDRAVLYANRGQMKKVLGLNDQAVKNCSKAIELNPEYLKAILRRAEIYEETDKLEDSLADYNKVVELDPKHLEANQAIRRLPPKIEARNEKLKAEMMDSLKKLGNMVLSPFGLSTNNFKMEQDPNSGGYNIQFQQ